LRDAETLGGIKLGVGVALNLVLWGGDVADLSVVVVQRAVLKRKGNLKGTLTEVLSELSIGQLTDTRKGYVAIVVRLAESGGCRGAVLEDHRGRVDAADFVSVVASLTTADLSLITAGRGGASAVCAEIDLSRGKVTRVGTGCIEDVIARECSCSSEDSVAGYGVGQT